MHFMNKQRGEHMSGKAVEKEAGAGGHESAGHSPSIHIHSHEKGHTVHILHPSGEHESHEHAKGDADGIAEHIHTHLGGGEGQDHGGSSGEEMEDESGFGPGV